jgi:hypothetical protein
VQISLDNFDAILRILLVSRGKFSVKFSDQRYPMSGVDDFDEVEAEIYVELGFQISVAVTIYLEAAV